ncbi:MAG TPA: hypothetical protein VJZ27_10880, partial [Aggregatilineales bacterium]|nr:hypothetical protein [Aggregatilineales bacterium]
YIILHYLFFYTMNNWRSTFHGVNDHEADWEQIFVYLNEQENAPPAPAWVAYASHDYDGDDLRRRWDDPEFMHIGSHPVIFAGAGSHASYFQAGEYLAKVELAFMKPVFDAIHFVQHFWRNVLRQGDPLNVIEKVEEFFRVPYVDYARGDGVSIGPDQLYSWSAILMDNEADWIFHYRGLWGLDTRDPLKGESAPGGPRYNRDGTVRQSWYDPLGWAGLRKVPPFPTFESALKQQITELEKELQAVDAEIAALDKELPELELEVRALQQFNHLVDLHQKRQERLRLGETDLNNLFARRTELQETLGACQAYDAQIQERGVFGSNPQAHIHHKHMPQSIDEVQSGRIASFWAAISSGLLLLSTISLAILQPDYWIAALSGVLILFWVVEAILRQ